MKEISLYIHIPFCKSKCLYCDFPSYSGKEILMDEYINALIKEILTKTNRYIIKSIFIGGGTPSYLNEENLDKLLKAINSINLKENLEFTVECNPGTLTEKKLHTMKKNNVNRLSIGLQSTNNNLLKKIGRIHTYNEFFENYHVAKNIGFNNINIDLMFGLPNQSIDDWKNTLKEVLKLKPNHISAYSLIIEEGTCFYNMYEKNKLELPTEEDERTMYSIGKKILEDNGYKQYEISNFAKEGYECFHNKIYWKCDEYLGVGVSASSFVDNKRFKNIDNINEYIKKINNDESIIEEINNNTKEENMEEFVFMGLRMIEGIDLKEFKNKFNHNIEDIYEKVINKNINRGLLIKDLGKLYLTSKGIEVSNYVMSDFIL